MKSDVLIYDDHALRDDEIVCLQSTLHSTFRFVGL